MLCGPGLDLVINAERAERGGDHPVCRPYHQRRAKIVHKQVEKGDQHIQHQEAFRKGAQTVLLAKLYQQQVDGNVGHDIDGRQPGDFSRPGAKSALQILQISGDDRVTQRPGQTYQQADHAIGDPFWGWMFRGGRGTQQGGFLVWLPLARSIRVALGQAHNGVYLSKC